MFSFTSLRSSFIYLPLLIPSLLLAIPAAADESYRLRSGFLEAVPIRLDHAPARTVDEWEEDDESLRTGLPIPGLFETVDEWEEDDESIRIGLPESGLFERVDEWEEDDESLRDSAVSCDGTGVASGEIRLFFDQPGILVADAGAADLSASLSSDRSEATALGPSKGLLAPVEPGSYLLRWTVVGELMGSCEPRLHFYPTCGLSGPDDHGDRLACASDVELGSEVSGEIQSAHDIDVFSFELTSHAGVSVQIFGERELDVSLLDAQGRRLSVNESERYGRDFWVDAELCPGRYFLRVEGSEESIGHYSLVTWVDPS